MHSVYAETDCFTRESLMAILASCLVITFRLITGLGFGYAILRCDKLEYSTIFTRGIIMGLLKTSLLITVLVFASTCSANILWSNPAGSADLFDFSRGSGDSGLYGSPSLIGGNTLTFFPSQFRAESINAAASSIADGIEFELNAHSGYSLGNISIKLQGDYGLLGTGQLDVSTALQIQNLNTSEIINGTVTTSTALPITSGVGAWQSTIYAETGGGNWTNGKITLDSSLLAGSFPGSVSFIQGKVLSSAIEMQVIPEPATMALLGIGAIVLIRKKYA